MVGVMKIGPTQNGLAVIIRVIRMAWQFLKDKKTIQKNTFEHCFLFFYIVFIIVFLGFKPVMA